jgi:ketosteroid isomerase-like protein
MSRESVEVIRDITAAINEGDFERAIGHLADDVVLEAPGVPPGARELVFRTLLGRALLTRAASA